MCDGIIYRKAELLPLSVKLYIYRYTMAVYTPYCCIQPALQYNILSPIMSQ